jgi:hypothetical protein
MLGFFFSFDPVSLFLLLSCKRTESFLGLDCTSTSSSSTLLSKLLTQQDGSQTLLLSV